MSLLSHYTSRQGLEGILSSQALWATNFLFVNDSSEFFYGWNALVEAAAQMTVDLIPAEKRGPELDPRAIVMKGEALMRQQCLSSDGYGELYVTSFARGATNDQDERGLLTLWDRYGSHQGYCLQFRIEDIRHMIELDSSKASYEYIGLSEVVYGIDHNNTEFKEIVFQLAGTFAQMIVKARSDIGINYPWDKMWPPSAVQTAAMRYCATHKDPCWIDEREIRILAYPSSESHIVPFYGIASPKKIRSIETKRYIEIGNIWRPGIEPRRVIIGTKADQDIAACLENCSTTPEIARANLPIS